MTTIATVIEKHNFQLCAKEAVAQKKGRGGCENPDCTFAHSIPEARSAFFKALGRIKAKTAREKSTKKAYLYVLIAPIHSESAVKFGGRVMKSGQVSMKFEDYLKWFEEDYMLKIIAETDETEAIMASESAAQVEA